MYRILLTDNELAIAQLLIGQSYKNYLMQVIDDIKEVGDIVSLVNTLNEAVSDTNTSTEPINWDIAAPTPEIKKWEPSQLNDVTVNPEDAAAVPKENCKGSECAHWDYHDGCTASLSELCTAPNIVQEHLRLGPSDPAEIASRDSNIANLYRAGKSPKQIADELNTTYNTVYARLKKMGLK